MATLTQVIGAIVNNDRSADNRVLTKQLHQSVLLGTLGNTLGIGDDVSQVTDVSVVVLWSTVGLGKRVEVGTSGSASVGVVTKSVNVESSQGVGVITGDLPGDGGWLGRGGLLERHDTGNALVTSDNCNCFVLVHVGFVDAK